METQPQRKSPASVRKGGRPALGTFDPKGMLNPYDIAVDQNGRLWVCEDDAQPKRYSVWSPDGSLWKDFYGSLPYSTSAYVDPKHPEHVYTENVRYEVDYEEGDWHPEATILRSRNENGIEFPAVHHHSGARIKHHGGRKFLAVGGQGATLCIYERVDGRWRPRVAYQEGDCGLELWVDDNTDGHVQVEEISPWKGRVGLARQWSVAIDKEDGLFVTALGQDQRSAYTMDHTMVLTENFNGTIWKHPQTGKTYFAGGDADCRIWELNGLGAISRRSVPVQVTARMAKQSEANANHNTRVREQEKAQARGRAFAIVRRAEDLELGAGAGVWEPFPARTIHNDGQRRATVRCAYDRQHLYARYEVSGAPLFKNSAKNFRRLFKSGSAVELCIATNTAKRKSGTHNVQKMDGPCCSTSSPPRASRSGKCGATLPPGPR